VLIVAASSAALAAGLLLGGYLGFGTWHSNGHPVESGAAEAAGASELGQFVEPGGDSLARVYLALISESDG
jgi:hypothetical protein